MSLNGDLEHFPIIDIIQLLHGSRKSGILRLSSAKGESQLVFHDGDLVSANYLNSRVRIGQVLVSAGAITEDQLNQALEIQKGQGEARKPLVITLLEHNMVDEKAAYNGIESLIEMTIVEVLTWKNGRFSLETGNEEHADGYHFSRSKFSQSILCNPQGILMESLRIFDEKVRDGTMDEILSIAGVSNQDLDAETPGGDTPSISSAGHVQNDSSASLQLLLAEQMYMSQRSSDQSYRAPDEVRKLIDGEYPSAANDQKQQLATLMAAPIMEGEAKPEPPTIAVIIITQSALLSTMVRSVCDQEGVYAVAADNIAALDIKIRLLMCQSVHLIILLDVPHENAQQDMVKVFHDLKKYPHASLVLIACALFWGTPGLQALGSGVRSIIPRPCKDCSEISSLLQAQTFCTELGAILRTLSPDHHRSDEQRFFDCISQLRNCKTRSEIMVAIMDFMSDVFERAIVFNVTASELQAGESFGIRGAKGGGVAVLDDLRIQFDDQQVFEDLIASGQMFYGFHSDSTCPHELYHHVGRPENPEILLFPFIRANKVVSFIYADFGPMPAAAPSLNHLEALVQFTTAQISVSAYRQKLKSLMDAATEVKPA